MVIFWAYQVKYIIKINFIYFYAFKCGYKNSLNYLSGSNCLVKGAGLDIKSLPTFDFVNALNFYFIY